MAPHRHNSKCINTQGLLTCGYGASLPSRVISLDFVQVADRLSWELARRHIPHLFVGGLAVSLNGYDRTTKDIDLVVMPRDKDALGNVLGIINESNMADGPRRVGKATFLGAGVDLLYLRDNEQLLKAQLKSELSPYAQLGALLYLKLLGSREKDFADVVELLKANGEAAGDVAHQFLMGEKLSGEQRAKLVKKLARAQKSAAREKGR